MSRRIVKQCKSQRSGSSANGEGLFPGVPLSWMLVASLQPCRARSRASMIFPLRLALLSLPGSRPPDRLSSQNRLLGRTTANYQNTVQHFEQPNFDQWIGNRNQIRYIFWNVVKPSTGRLQKQLGHGAEYITYVFLSVFYLTVRHTAIARLLGDH